MAAYSLGKGIRPESEETSEYGCQFLGKADDRGTWWTTPAVRQPQDPDWGKAADSPGS